MKPRESLPPVADAVSVPRARQLLARHRLVGPQPIEAELIQLVAVLPVTSKWRKAVEGSSSPRKHPVDVVGRLAVLAGKA